MKIYKYILYLTISSLLLFYTSHSFTYDESKLKNCFCWCGCSEEGWICGNVVCKYDPEGTFDSSCSDVSKGECVCSGFGCGRAAMPSGGECYESCIEKYGKPECGDGECEYNKDENCLTCAEDCSCGDGKVCDADNDDPFVEKDNYGCVEQEESNEDYTVCEQFCDDGVVYVPIGKDEYGQCKYETEICKNGCDDFGSSCAYYESSSEAQSCENFCDGNTLYYDGFYNEKEGQCYYYTVECPDACDDGKCIRTKRTFDSLEVYLSKESIVLNGRDEIKVDGMAYGKNNEGKKLPYSEKELEVSYYISSSQGNLNPSSLYLSIPSSTTTDSSGRFSFYISSYQKLPNNIYIKDAKLHVQIENKEFEVPLYSPIPVIKSIKLLNNPSVWQGSYGTFEVVVEDKDNNLAEYEISSKYGNIRIEGMEWGEGATAIYNKCRYSEGLAEHYCPLTFNFAWRAPETSEKLILDYVGFWDKVKEKAPESISNIALEGAKEFLHPVNRMEVEVFQKGYDGYKLYTGTKESISAIKKQSQELGESYEKGNWYFFEFLARTASMSIEAYSITDGFFSFVVPSEGGIINTLKDEAKGITLDYLKDNLNRIADTYKAARAEKIKVPFIIKVKVTDNDGYSDEKGVLVEVEGYESIMDA